MGAYWSLEEPLGYKGHNKLSQVGPPYSKRANLCSIRSLQFSLSYLGRVVGGTDVTDPTLFPFFGSLQLNSTEAPLCGGTILDKFHFLTAAHCDDRPMIRVGSVRRVSIEGIPDTPSGKKAQSLKIRFCKKHPNSKKHKNGVTEFDFKVCKLFAPIHFGESKARNNP